MRSSCNSALAEFFLVLLGATLILLATRWGIGASPDSIAYLAGARHLAAGHGFSLLSGESQAFEPISHFPPGYSALLAMGGVFGQDPVSSVRWINGLLFGASIFLVGLSLQRALTPARGTNFWIPLAASVAMLISYTSLQVYLMAWSEGLFIVLGLVSFGLLGNYFDRGQPGYLIIGGALIGIAVITRYAGVAFLLTALVGSVIFHGRSWARRIVDSLALGLLGSLPFLLWTFRNLSLTGTPTNRVLLYHPISRSKLWEGLTTVGTWFFIGEGLPTLLKVVLLGLVGLLLTGGLFAGLARSAAPNSLTVSHFQSIDGTIKLFAIFVLVYSLFLALSITFFDANTPLDSRILSPVFVALLILAFFAIGVFYQSGVAPRALVLAGAGLFLVFGGLSLSRLANLALPAYTSGVGFNHVSWRESETLALVATLPDGTPIYSNAPEAIYLHTGRGASRIPRPFESVNQRENPAYAAELAAMQTTLAEGSGVLVYFDGIGRNTRPTQEELITLLGAQIKAQAEDGAIYTGGEGD